MSLPDLRINPFDAPQRTPSHGPQTDRGHSFPRPARERVSAPRPISAAGSTAGRRTGRGRPCRSGP
jgi:hypothetical protein